jgi:3-deoxy-7-phosphoheptulonate synthase
MQPPGSTADFTEVRPWESTPAGQQPDWRHHAAYEEVRHRLASAPPLVTAAEVRRLRWSLSRVMTSNALLLQGGDCAESLYECSEACITEKLNVIDRLACRLSDLTGRPVIRVGRMGGQFAKPRSQAMERHGDTHIPAFRGHMINSEVAAPATRKANPRRMLSAYDASDNVQRVMRRYRRMNDRIPGEGPWSSHEALVIDYESRLIRADSHTKDQYLTSTHLPWVGERTRDPAGAHVALLASVANPVECKVGSTATPEDILGVCAALNPRREPGRLILIPRMGRDAIGEVLPPIVRRVADAGYPVIWLSDPMHGNTVAARKLGLKTRYLDDIITEALRFRDIIEGHRQHAAGLHIELAASNVTECIGGPVKSEDDLPRHYSTLCDPRLNAEQATELIEAWAKSVAGRAQRPVAYLR